MATETQIPYGTYGRVRGMIDQFAESITPTSLNKHVLDGISGGDFSALMSSLKFLGLINENQTVKPKLRELVDARKQSVEAYQEQMAEIISDAYSEIVKDVDLDHGTLPELEKAFKDAGVPAGQMVTKAIRFYIKALEDCGLKVSDYITKPRTPTKSKSSKGAKAQKKTRGGGDVSGKSASGDDAPNTPAQQSAVPEGFQRIAIPSNPNAFVQFPMEISVKDCDQFEGIMDMLRRFAGIPREGGKP